jgi:hypothetical protein
MAFAPDLERPPGCLIAPLARSEPFRLPPYHFAGRSQPYCGLCNRAGCSSGGGQAAGKRTRPVCRTPWQDWPPQLSLGISVRRHQAGCKRSSKRSRPAIPSQADRPHEPTASFSAMGGRDASRIRQFMCPITARAVAGRAALGTEDMATGKQARPALPCESDRPPWCGWKEFSGSVEPDASRIRRALAFTLPSTWAASTMVARRINPRAP